MGTQSFRHKNGNFPQLFVWEQFREWLIVGSWVFYAKSFAIQQGYICRCICLRRHVFMQSLWHTKPELPRNHLGRKNCGKLSFLCQKLCHTIWLHLQMYMLRFFMPHTSTTTEFYLYYATHLHHPPVIHLRAVFNTHQKPKKGFFFLPQASTTTKFSLFPCERLILLGGNLIPGIHSMTMWNTLEITTQWKVKFCFSHTPPPPPSSPFQTWLLENVRGWLG